MLDLRERDSRLGYRSVVQRVCRLDGGGCQKLYGLQVEIEVDRALVRERIGEISV
jgi:hypothetical protein